MKNSIYALLVILFFSVLFFSCNKDDAVSPGNGNNNNTGPITQTFSSNITTPIPIAPNTFTSDSLNANITFGINASNVSDVKLNLNTLEGVIVSNLRFALFHNGVEVFVIDNPLTVSGTGNITNLVLSDSSSNQLSNVNSYPISGIYRPQHLLSSFDNLGASGYWTLRIINSGSLRTGVIKSWGITLSYMPVAPPTTQIFPLATGNIWITEKRDSIGMLMSVDTTKILNSIIYQNKTMFRIYSNNMGSDEIYACNESDGLRAYNISQNWNQLIYKYPINVGEWYIGGGNGDTVKCLSTNETVSTPSGNYSGCIKYQVFDHYQGNVSFSYTYVKPGVGEVGSDHYRNSGMSITQTFTSYPNLNKIISNSGPVLDTIYASIMQNNIADVKLTLGDVENVEVDKIKFSLLHGGNEVYVIDALTNTGVGNFINTVLSDSAITPIDNGQSPYTGTFKPQNPLSGFNYSNAAGTWILKIIYSGALKSGVINSWSVTIRYTNQPQLILDHRDRLIYYHLNP